MAVLCWGQGAQRPLKFFTVHKLLNTGQLDTVVLLLVDVIGSIVISLSRCCLPNDDGPAPPPNIFPIEPPVLYTAGVDRYSGLFHYCSPAALLGRAGYTLGYAMHLYLNIVH